MIPDDEKFEFSSPIEQEWKENIVEEYLTLDLRIGKLYRFIEWSQEFGRMDKDTQDMMRTRLELYKRLRVILNGIAEREGVWEEIRNLMQ